MKSQDDLPWTGERLVTSIFNYGAIDHLHRYAIAIELVKGKDVLDIASGEGYGSYLISAYAKSVVGVDISQEAVDHASKKYRNPNLQFKTGSADRIPLPDASLDVVTSFETIEHHDKHNEMLAEIKRVLKPGGILLISSPDKLNYSEIPGIVNEFHIKELYQHEFKALMQKHFTNVLFLNQKSVYGSLIVPEINPKDYNEFLGNYEGISWFDKIQSPVYNICVASEGKIPDFSISIFFGKENKAQGEESNSAPVADKSTKTQIKKVIKLFLPPIVIRILRGK